MTEAVQASAQAPARAATGIEGLDYILRGGLPRNMPYLLLGTAGTGKTTLGLQFLLEGARRGERVLYASLLQTHSEMQVMFQSHGWPLDDIDLIEMPADVRRAFTDEQTLFSPADIELREVTETLIADIQKHRPQRLLFDSVTELAVLVDSPAQLCRRMLKLKQELLGLGCTTIFTVNNSTTVDLPTLQTMVHGMIELGVERPVYGPPHRWLDVAKMRAMEYLGGRHDFRIRTGGLEVYPRLEISPHVRTSEWKTISSGNESLDTLFGGGLEDGTACLITGTTGAGKSTLASLYVQAAAERGERAVVFCFDERRETFLRRSAGLGMDLPRYVEQGLVDLRQINVGDITPGEFAQSLRQAVEEQQVKVVMIDSITGYLNVMPEQRRLMLQLHEVLSYLGGAGVLTLLVVSTHGVALPVEPDIDISYITDTVVLLRTFEADGRVRRCISVIKKRSGPHEKTIREVSLDSHGFEVGEALQNFHGVFSGTPEFTGDREKGDSTEPRKTE